MQRTPMILSAFFFNPQGDHRMSWRHPDAPGREIFDLSYYRRLAESRGIRSDGHNLRR
jgi:hypothetical protein